MREIAGSAAETASNAAIAAQNTAADAKRIAGDAARTVQAAGGLYPRIIVFVTAGDVVTCTDGVRSFEKTADNALVVFDVPDYGEWTVSVLRDDLPSNNVIVEVDTAKQYTIALAFFTSTITVTGETGSTVVCEGGGRTQTKISDGSVVFTVTSAATYTITAASGDETTSRTVEITASEQAKTITLEYFRSMITVNIATGAYVTCMDGTTTLDGISSGSVVLEVHSAAAWQVAASMNGRTTTGTVTITASGHHAGIFYGDDYGKRRDGFNRHLYEGDRCADGDFHRFCSVYRGSLQRKSQEENRKKSKKFRVLKKSMTKGPTLKRKTGKICKINRIFW